MVVSLFPVESTENVCLGNLFHKGLCDSSDKVLCGAYERLAGSVIKRNLFCHIVKILLNGNIGSEMKILFKLVGVGIPLTVEVSENEPIGIEKLFGRRKSECAEKKLFKLKVCYAILFARADVVEFAPKLLGNVVAADIGKKSARILDCCPLKNAVNRNVEHNRVHIFKDCGVKNT